MNIGVRVQEVGDDKSTAGYFKEKARFRARRADQKRWYTYRHTSQPQLRRIRIDTGKACGVETGEVLQSRLSLPAGYLEEKW